MTRKGDRKEVKRIKRKGKKENWVGLLTGGLRKMENQVWRLCSLQSGPKPCWGDGEASWLMPGRDTMASTTASTQWTPGIDPQGLALCCR